MKKRLIVFGLIFSMALLVSCEEDDVCVGEGTPNLTIVFRDALNSTNKMDSLTIHYSDHIDFDDPVLLYDKVFTDSLKLPLSGLVYEKRYFKIQRRSNSNSDILTVNYQPTSEYISKACGFRVVYEDLNYNITQHHIHYVIPNESNELKDETETDLYIVLSD